MNCLHRGKPVLKLFLCEVGAVDSGPVDVQMREHSDNTPYQDVRCNGIEKHLLNIHSTYVVGHGHFGPIFYSIKWFYIT